MQLLTDFLPIISFFIAFKLYGIYVATAVAMIISIAQVIVYRLKNGKFATLPLVTLAIIAVLGGATLLSHNDLFIKWKVTVVDWVFALILLATQWTDKPTLKRLLGEKMQLPNTVWKNVNLSWAVFFIGTGILNLYVAYHFNTQTWVNFKLFGILGLTLIFALGQAAWLAKYVKDYKK